MRGVVGIGGWLRIPPAIAGATIAAFATSGPELAVSTLAAAAGTPQIGLGDALGSNIFNIAVVFGFTLLISASRMERGTARREFRFALAAPALAALLLVDGVLSRWDAMLLLALFLTWVGVVLRDAWHHRSRTAAAAGTGHPGRSAVAGALGLVLLLVAGHLIVGAAQDLARALGIAPYMIGATLVAAGTSMPELVTALVAKLRGHDEVGVGTLLGSNLFNGLFIVAVAALIHPIVVEPASVVASLAIGACTVVLILPAHDGTITRHRGALLLLVYVAYVALLLRT